MSVAPAAPAPATPARFGAIEAGKVGEVQRPWAREALAAWRTRRVAQLPGAVVSHRVDDVFRCGNCEDLLVTERVIEGGVCREGPFVLNIARDDGEPTRLDARAIALDCCPGAACPDRTPTAWLLRLNHIVETGDHDALRPLVAPGDGLAVYAGFRDGADSSESSTTVTRDGSLAAVFETIQAIQLFHDHVACDAGFAKEGGQAVCTVHGGGFQATYRWRKDGEQVYLLEVSQESH